MRGKIKKLFPTSFLYVSSLLVPLVKPPLAARQVAALRKTCGQHFGFFHIFPMKSFVFAKNCKSLDLKENPGISSNPDQYRGPEGLVAIRIDWKYIAGVLALPTHRSGTSGTLQSPWAARETSIWRTGHFLNY